MGRKVAMLWHASFTIGAGVLYYFFVLPRWPELLGDTGPGLGMALRIVTGVLIGLAALPVVFTLLRTRKPELGTPQLALTIRTWSIVAHVAAGVLIVGTAISENWVSLDKAGQWLFAIYGAAAAIAVLGFFAFYLSFIAELPPPPPKPIKPKKEKKRRLRGKKRAAVGGSDDHDADDDEDEEKDEKEHDDESVATADDAAAEPEEDSAEEVTEAETVEAKTDETVESEGETVEADSPVSAGPEKDEPPEAAPVPDEESEAAAETVEAPLPETAAQPRLRNRRPTGKTSHRRRRTRGGVAVEE
ncbi:hypothetical protein [Mycobacterium vicinigordonae]|uniref:Transmembrane protein n=1 Tax=Mycobacterium vicinigordonae TaxID=1719132 RepID=A0A7D6DXH5_9MYCO|nr:hypothetical protein [Mycobacterium vicinigordonae]QLL07227.1 hypothetical protein H0P51_26795 [Mycobacterium vicinigordonae]